MLYVCMREGVCTYLFICVYGACVSCPVSLCSCVYYVCVHVCVHVCVQVLHIRMQAGVGAQYKSRNLWRLGASLRMN
jgi:hypothetical protein